MPMAKSRQEKLAQMRREALRGGGSKSSVAAASAQAEEDRRTSGAQSARGPQTDHERELMPMSARGPDDPLAANWSMFDKMAATLQEKDSERALRQKKELQARFRSDLEQQVSDTKMKKAREKEWDSKYHEDMVASYQTWKQGEEAKVHQVRAKAVNGAHAQQEFAKESNERREAERQREKAEALALVQQNRRLADEDQTQSAMKLAVKREEYKKVLQANQSFKGNKKDADKVSAEEEMAKQAMYQRQRDARDKMVEDAKQAKVHLRQCISESMGSQIAESDQKARQESIRKALAERDAMDKLSLEKENEKKMKLRKDREAIQNYQIDQIHKKEALRQAELEQRKKIAQQLESDVEQFQREQQNKSQAARNRNLQFRMELEKQMQAKNAAQIITRDGMSDTELKINKKLLQNAQQILGVSAGGGAVQSAQ